MNKQNCRIAGLQMISGPRVADNLVTATRLAVLPEYFPIIGATDADRVLAREAFGEGPIQSWLSETAQRHGIWLFAGSIPLTAASPDKMRNSSLVFDPDGECVKRYDKVHLFGFRKGDESYDEASFIEPGDHPVAVDTPFGRVALSICYDLRFPELYRALAPVDLILVPVGRTGKFCCAPVPSRTSAIFSLSDKVGAMKTGE